jgi:oxygen-independent coproporphyrinogen-3 oxidase
MNKTLYFTIYFQKYAIELMAGIYLHIPFCKQACNYCNFYFSTSLHFKEAFVERILEEIPARKNYLSNQTIESIYFGGGTPSILEAHTIEEILNVISKHYILDSVPEITLEANPDDLSKVKLKDLRKSGINRLSIGTQSFQDRDLQFMRRAHNAQEALNSIQSAQDIGLDNISIDLIYGTPTLSKQAWEDNLNTAADLQVQHLSCYALTVEEGTALFHQIRKGQVAKVNDKLAAENFKMLRSWAKDLNWDHYEISNLCKNGKISKHNTSYWKGEWYLGLGPGAHSFNGKSRQWNKPNLKGYIDKKANQIEIEHLSLQDQYNEYIMTGLRTKWGISTEQIENVFPNFYPTFESKLKDLDREMFDQEESIITLSEEGLFYADGIAAHFFEINEETKR